MDPSALLVPLALVAMAYCKLRRAPMRGGADSDWTEAMDAIASGIRDSCGESIVFTEDIDETACCVCNATLSSYEALVRSMDDMMTYYIPAPDGATRSIVVCAYDVEDDEVTVHLVCSNPKVPRLPGITFHLLMYALCDIKMRHAGVPIKLKLSNDPRAQKLYESLGFGCPGGLGHECDLDDVKFEDIVGRLVAGKHVEAANSEPLQ